MCTIAHRTSHIAHRLIFALCTLLMICLPAFADVAINSSNFPDSNFRSYISSNFDTNKDGSLSDSEIATVTAIDVTNSNVKKLDGVKTFTNLVSLKCADNYLTKLDVSGLTSLAELNVSNNSRITELNVSGTSLTNESFDFSVTQPGSMKTFNASNCTLLKSLEFYASYRFPKLETIDVSGCTSLEDLYCQPLYLAASGTIKELNVSGCTNLKTVKCDGSQITILQFTGCSSLEYVDISDSRSLTSLEVSDCTNLATLYCYYSNNLTALDLSQSAALKRLTCSYSGLTTLDLSPNAEFTAINISNQQIPAQTFLEDNESEEYKYYFDFRLLVPSEKISGIIEASVRALNGESEFDTDDYTYSDGILRLKSIPTKIEYEYDTGNANNHLIVSFNVSNKAGTIYKPTIQTSSLNLGVSGISYTSDITVSSNTTQPVDWSITSGTLPSGLALSAAQTTNGKVSITGTPTEAGTFTFTLQASNKGGTASRTFSITIGGSPSGILPEITTSSLPTGNVNVAYALTLHASGQTPITWSITSGSLPTGLTLTTGGLITGTPSASGSYTFTVQAQNSLGSDTKTFTLSIGDDEVSSKPLITTPAELDDVIAGSAYEFQLSASGTSPITWKITKGSLPTGLKLSTSGLISGTTNRAGKFSITIKASNSMGDDTRIFTMTSYIFPEITTSSIKNARVGTSYNMSFTAKGTAPLEWNFDGDLPDGLTFDSSKGKITGKPTINGTYNFTLGLSNAAGSVSKDFSLTVIAVAPKIGTNSLPNGTTGKAYRAKLSATGTLPITWSIEGDLPDGLVFDPETGLISGTPTEMCNKQSITITASNMASEVSKTFALTINGAVPIIKTTKLPNGNLGTEYSTQIIATGTSPITFNATGLPAGLSVSDDMITGIPTESGTFRVTLTAANLMKTVKKTFSLVVVSPPVFNDGGIIDEGTAGVSYSYNLDVSGTKKITYAISGGSLPNGITVNANTGALRGIPKDAGTFEFTVTAKNSAGESSMTYNMMINAEAPKITGRFLSGTVGKFYRVELKVSGTAPIIWSIDGYLPDGLVFVDGMLIGTPTEAFNDYISVTASNSGGSHTKTYRLLVKAANVSVSSSPESEDQEQIMLPEDTQVIPEIHDDVHGLIDDEYVVVAVLPEISVDVSGMHEFNVTLSDDANAGEKLIWFANSESPSDDDEIAEFYDESGEEIETVPENRKVTIDAWLTEGITYEPVIAVKRKE